MTKKNSSKAGKKAEPTAKKSVSKKVLHKTKVDPSGKVLMDGSQSLEGKSDIPTVAQTSVKKKKKAVAKGKGGGKLKPLPRPLLPEEIVQKQQGQTIDNTYKSFTIHRIASIIETVTVEALTEDAAVAIARDLEPGHWTVQKADSTFKAEVERNASDEPNPKKYSALEVHPQWARVAKMYDDLDMIAQLRPHKLKEIVFNYKMYTEDQRELDEKIFATLGGSVAHALADSIDARISAIKSKYISLENHLPFELAIFNYAAWLLEPRIVAENEQNVLRLPIVLGLWGESLIS